MRIGHGYDSHLLVPGRRLFLGGVELPFDKGLKGHSDADALIHAIIDSLFGAAGIGDIGVHFPDTDEKYKGVSSVSLLVDAAAKVRSAGYEVVNIDSTVICQAPKISPHAAAMRERIAEALSIDPARVSIKGKTNEGMDAVGEGRGIVAYAVCLLREV